MSPCVKCYRKNKCSDRNCDDWYSWFIFTWQRIQNIGQALKEREAHD